MGNILKVEDLEAALKNVTFDIKNIKLWPKGLGKKLGFSLERRATPKWKDMFDVVSRVKTEVVSKTLFISKKQEVTKYVVINKKNGQEVGEYNDHTYACSRARYFYKRDMRRAEKILLGG